MLSESAWAVLTQPSCSTAYRVPSDARVAGEPTMIADCAAQKSCFDVGGFSIASMTRRTPVMLIPAPSTSALMSRSRSLWDSSYPARVALTRTPARSRPSRR